MRPRSLCFYPQYVVPHVETPLFLINSAYDAYQIGFILAPSINNLPQSWERCKNDTTTCSQDQIEILKGFRSEFLGALPRLGALFDTALLSAVAAFSHLNTPVVSLNDDGRVVVSEAIEGQNLENEPVNKDKRKLKSSTIPFSLTSILHKHYILADPTAEEESTMNTLLTVVLDSSCQLVSLFKPGGTFVAYNSSVQAGGFPFQRIQTEAIRYLVA